MGKHACRTDHAGGIVQGTNGHTPKMEALPANPPDSTSVTFFPADASRIDAISRQDPRQEQRSCLLPGFFRRLLRLHPWVLEPGHGKCIDFDNLFAPDLPDGYVNLFCLDGDIFRSGLRVFSS